MKRFGLRALAGTLATLMVVSAFAPAKAASAADDIILIAPNPNALKTLYITEDMVDEDGEIVISGGSYDRVVVAKEVAAKDIYFDQVTVGEMVVESGGESRIQLWEVDAEQVTVQEPELEALSFTDLKDLLADEETRAAALQMYLESHAKDEKTKKTAPTIVTKEDATVDSFVARANATLDLAEGEVSVVALEGSEKVDRAKVTLKNYKGDVSFKGTEGKSNMTLNNVDSRINTLKVEESDADDYFMVNAKNSVVIKAEVGGNANLSLNALTGALEVTEKATAANVTLLNTVEEMNIAGNGATVEVAPCARVEMMAVAGNDAKVTGSGTLVEADITGKGAYVSTYGSKVKGENTYVPPVYVEPAVPKVEFTNIDLVADEGVEVVKNANGSATINFSGQYKKAYFNVPSSVDINRVSKVIMNITAPGNFGLKIHTTEGVDITSNSWFPNGNGTAADYSYDVNPARQKIGKLEFMSTSAGSSFTVNSITFELLDEAPKVEEKPLVTENLSYTFNDMKIDWKAEGVTNSIDANGAMTISYTGQYQGVVCRFPQAINPVDYPELVFNVVSANGALGIKIWQVGEEGDTNNNPKICSWDNQPATAENITVDISNASASIEKVEFLSGTTASYQSIINSITAIGSGNVGNEGGGNQGGSNDPVVLPSLPTNSEVFTMDKFTEFSKWDATPSLKDGVLDVTYKQEWNEVRYSFPKEFNLSEYKEVIVTAKTPTVGEDKNITVKLYANDAALDENDNPVTFKDYNNFNSKDVTNIVIDVSGIENVTMDRIGFMAGQYSTNAAVTVYRVALVPKDPTGSGSGGTGSGDQSGTGSGSDGTITPSTPTQEMTYTADQLTKSWANAGYELNGKKVTLTFTDKYQEARFKLPETLDLSKVESIVYHFESHTGLINLNIWTSIEENGTKINFYANSGATSYTKTVDATDKVDYIGVQVGGDSAPEEGANAVFLGVTINMKEEAGGSGTVTPDVTVEIATPATTTLTLDDTLTLTATATGTESTITWSSSNPAVATVDAGIVTPVAGGDVEIIATCEGKTAKVALKVEKAFYLKSWDGNKWAVSSKDVPFSVTMVGDGGNNVTTIADIYLNGENFANSLPLALKNDETVYAAFQNLKGILSYVESFEYKYVLTEATAKTGGSQYDPQSQSVVQGYNASTDGWGAGKYEWSGIGVPTEGSPKTTTKVINTSTMAEWTEETIGKVGLQLVNGEPGTKATGTYTVKINLK